MRTLRHGILAAVMAGGCTSPMPAATTMSPPPDAAAGHDAGARDADPGPTIAVDQGGTRIELRHWMTAEGTDAGHVFHDRTQNVDCTWYSVDSNKYRCLPSDSVLYYPTRFADSLCMQPVYEFNPGTCGQSPPAYIREESAIPTCPTSVVLRKMGAKLAAHSYFLRAKFGACVSVPAATGTDLYAYGDPVPLTNFVAGTVRVGPTVNQFAQRTVEGEDGSRVILAFHDFAKNVDCRTLTAADGSFRCLPFVVGTMSSFRDDACTMPAGSGAKSGCAASTSFLSRSTRNGCLNRTSILPAGDRLTVGYESFSTGCDTSTGAPFIDYWSGGDEIAPDTFVSATLTTADGTSRVRRRNIGTPAGMLPTESLWDTKLDRACSATKMIDGTYRCVGAFRPNLIVGTFADPQCTQETVEDVPDAQGTSCSVGYYYKSEAGQCPPRGHLFNIDDKPYTGPQFHRDATMACVPDPRVPTGPVHLLGPEAMPSEFVEIKPPAP
jgi:hypothetical protein